MWRGMMEKRARGVELMIHRAALEAVFDECDRYDHDETGGRIIGTYSKTESGTLAITVSGVIETGPASKRSATSFFQDGAYQEAIFRQLEQQHPTLEHLGNWHTHHVNGYPTLSGGDRETYHRTVNHQQHNTEFFYALLVTTRRPAKKSGDRYDVRHYILYRGDPSEYEIKSSNIHIVDAPLIWPAPQTPIVTPAPAKDIATNTRQRTLDKDFFEEFYPAFKPFKSKAADTIYWRGLLDLVDDAVAEVIVAELLDGDQAQYCVVLKSGASAANAPDILTEKRFKSARAAVHFAERELNRFIYRQTHVRSTV